VRDRADPADVVFAAVIVQLALLALIAGARWLPQPGR